MISWIVISTLLIALSGVPGLFLARSRSGGEILSGLLVLAGVGAGLAGVLKGLHRAGETTLEFPWSIPGGALVLSLDGLSMLFLLPLFLVVGCGALYGFGYWPQRKHPDNGRRLRLFYGLISAAMITLLTARNGLLFLLAWEIMALSGFFLVTTEEDKAEARRAGYVYLAATHTGTLALFAMFVLLDQGAGAFGFPVAGSVPFQGSAVFLFGLFGFGLKAGLIPLHIWLPGAHAAAPSHASALLSGVMIKTGIYGLVRLTSFFAVIPPWWGWTVLMLGVLSGIFGVVFALAQHDIKRLLAYHSVENIGIIALGLGLALLGRSYDLPALTLLGMAGALLHVVNHGLFKSLLFLSAGSVIHAVGTREIDRYGGILRRQPLTALFFLGGAVAICGLPPLNGFVSEWLIYLGSFAALESKELMVVLAVLVAPALALIGGLALACFVKVFGITFLGEARTMEASTAHESTFSMLLAMAPLLAACTWIGLFPSTVAGLLENAVRSWNPALSTVALTAPLAPVPMIGVMGLILLAALVLVGFWLGILSRKGAEESATWGCGYAQPTVRMQYTASSFADGLVRLFRFGLWTERSGDRVDGIFPRVNGFHSQTPDTVLDRGLFPGFRLAGQAFVWLRSRVQNGKTARYLLYVALTVVFLLLIRI
ncbi:MAG: proton-conducting transporter membrane subunit [Syntrophotaleaceae bacterium]